MVGFSKVTMVTMVSRVRVRVRIRVRLFQWCKSLGDPTVSVRIRVGVRMPVPQYE